MDLDAIDADILFIKVFGIAGIAADDIGLGDIKPAVVFIDAI